MYSHRVFSAAVRVSFDTVVVATPDTAISAIRLGAFHDGNRDVAVGAVLTLVLTHRCSLLHQSRGSEWSFCHSFAEHSARWLCTTGELPGCAVATSIEPSSHLGPSLDMLRYRSSRHLIWAQNWTCCEAARDDAGFLGIRLARRYTV